jgi:hypothetical protein
MRFNGGSHSIVLVILALILTACGPDSYEDCILENMKGVSDRLAAVNIKIACEVKYKKDEDAKVESSPTAQSEPAEINNIPLNKTDKVIGLYSDIHPEEYKPIKEQLEILERDHRYINASDDIKTKIRADFFDEVISPKIKVADGKYKVELRKEFINKR